LIATAIHCFSLSLCVSTGTQAIQAAKVSQAHDNGTEVKINALPGFGIGWKDLPQATLHLLKNPCYMCITMDNAMNFFFIMGISTFAPKIIANQFSLSLSWSSMLTGKFDLFYSIKPYINSSFTFNFSNSIIIIYFLFL